MCATRRNNKFVEEDLPLQAPQTTPTVSSIAGGVDTQFGFIMGQIVDLHKVVAKNTETLKSIEDKIKSSGDTLKELNDVKNKIIGAAWVVGILLTIFVGVVGWAASKAITLLSENVSITAKQSDAPAIPPKVRKPS